MTNKVRERLYRKYGSDKEAILDWREGMWEVILQFRDDYKDLDLNTEEDVHALYRRYLENLKELDDLLTYFLTRMNPQWNNFLDQT